MTDPAPSGLDRRSTAKHAAILDAATSLFLGEGYARTSMNAVATASGVSKQTLYGHFESKQQLFLAVVDRVRSAHGVGRSDAPDVVSDTGDTRHDLRTTGVRLLRALLAPEAAALHRMTIAELTHHPELQRAWRDDTGVQETITAIAEFLTAREREGSLVVPNPERAARQFVLLLSSEGQVRSLRGLEPLAESDIEQIADDTADLILRAHRA